MFRQFSLLGGRGLIDRILTKEVEADICSLGLKNNLIVAPGLFAATAMPNSGRLSIGGKSPLTSGIKETNSGGTVARKLRDKSRDTIGQT